MGTESTADDPRWVDTCGCGRPLHYNDPSIERLVRAAVVLFGGTIDVQVVGGGAYRVPRHYIALHGLHGRNVVALGVVYGWEEVPG